MRIKKTKSKNFVHYSIIKDVNINGKRTTKIYENIGNLDELKKRAGNQEPIEWLNEYVKSLNQQLKENSLPIVIKKIKIKLLIKIKILFLISVTCFYKKYITT